MVFLLLDSKVLGLEAMEQAGKQTNFQFANINICFTHLKHYYLPKHKEKLKFLKQNSIPTELTYLYLIPGPLFFTYAKLGL